MFGLWEKREEVKSDIQYPNPHWSEKKLKLNIFFFNSRT